MINMKSVALSPVAESFKQYVLERRPAGSRKSKKK